METVRNNNDIGNEYGVKYLDISSCVEVLMTGLIRCSSALQET